MNKNYAGNFITQFSSPDCFPKVIKCSSEIPLSHFSQQNQIVGERDLIVHLMTCTQEAVCTWLQPLPPLSGWFQQ